MYEHWENKPIPLNFLLEAFLCTFLGYSWLRWRSAAADLALRFPHWKLGADQDLRFFSSEERPLRVQSQQEAQPQMGVWQDAMCRQNPLSAPNGKKSLDMSSEINSELARLAQSNETTEIGVKKDWRTKFSLESKTSEVLLSKTFTPSVAPWEVAMQYKSCLKGM